MGRAHVISRQILEIVASDRTQATLAQARIADVFRSGIVPVIERVVSAFVNEERVIRIDRLVVDLGVLALPELETKLASKVEEAMSNALSAQLEQVHNDNSEWGHCGTAAEANLEMLRLFLETGRLPWWATSSDHSIPDTLLETVLESEGVGGVSSLLRSLPNPATARRIARQFGVSVVRRLIASLFGAEQIQLWIDLWIRRLRHENYGSPGIPLSTRVLDSTDRFVHEVTLHSILSRSSNPSLEELSESLLDAAARRLGRSRQETASRLAERAMSAPRMNAASEDLCRWINEQANGSAFLSGEASRHQPKSFESSSGKGSETPQCRSHVIEATEQVSDGMRHPEASQESFLSDRPDDPSTIPERADDADRHASVFDQRLLMATPSEPRLPAEGSSGNDGWTSPANLTRSSAVSWGSSLNRRWASEVAYIGNAGLVLVWPYLPRFFTSLGLASSKAFLSDESQERGVLLLQLLATGFSDASEPELLLNKLLCGWPAEKPVVRSIEPSQPELAESVDLLASVIANWSVLGRTSVHGLQQAFLQRDGRLELLESGWNLFITRAAHDVLIERLTWGIGLIFLPWMERPLSVEW